METEHWSNAEIKEACSFTNFSNKIYNSVSQLFTNGRPILRTKEDLSIWQESLRNKLISLLKIDDLLNLPKPVTIIKCNKNYTRTFKNFALERFYIKSWMDTLIPVCLCVPKTMQPIKKNPAVVCLHGHVMKKENLVGLKKNWIYSGTWAKDLAERGCITISADQWGFGERGGFLKRKKNNYDHSESKYALNMLLMERTINGLRTYDAIQQINYLLTREDVDPEKIGIAGLSLGGTIASYTAAIDTRVDLALIAGFLSTYKASILDKNHCTDNYIPNILNHAELFDVLSLISPRKLFFINGVKDPIFPIESAVYSFHKIQKKYDICGKKENLGIDITPYGHKWIGKNAYEFVRKHWFSESSSSNKKD